MPTQPVDRDERDGRALVVSQARGKWRQSDLLNAIFREDGVGRKRPAPHAPGGPCHYQEWMRGREEVIATEIPPRARLPEFPTDRAWLAESWVFQNSRTSVLRGTPASPQPLAESRPRSRWKTQLGSGLGVQTHPDWGHQRGWLGPLSQEQRKLPKVASRGQRPQRREG